jgi:hypothetical protein
MAIPNYWERKEPDGDFWRLLVENDSFDGKTQVVVLDGTYIGDGGEEEAFLGTPTPDEAREIAAALTAYANAVERANEEASRG